MLDKLLEVSSKKSYLINKYLGIVSVRVLNVIFLYPQLLEAKVGLLHKEEEIVHEVRLDEAQRDSELQNR